jgi:periplasmic protein TonB
MAALIRATGSRSRTPLPSTRIARHRRGRRGWSVAVLVAVAVNLGVVILLVQVSRVARAPAVAPHAVQRIVQEEPPPPDEPDEVDPAPEEPAEPLPLTMPVPALDLAPPDASASFSLPALTERLDPALLPISVPAFAVAGPPALGASGRSGLGSAEFDEAPSVRSDFDIDRFYPRSARLRRVEGQTVMRLEVDAAGAVRGITVVSSTPAGVFDQAAGKLARTLSCTPAKRGGAPVASTLTITVQWKMR